MEKRISVRGLVEHVLKSGSIDSGFSGVNRMQEGAHIHRRLQKAGGENYHTEITLSITETCLGVAFTVEGRADGVITEAGRVTLDEIKTTLLPLEALTELSAPEVHWAQAMVYGHIYCRQNALAGIDIQLTYYNMDTGMIKRLTRHCTAEALSGFFTGLLEKYAPWAVMEHNWRLLSRESMRACAFPFPEYRPGQRRLAAAVYRTIERGGRLYAAAPTGIGKTISSLFPALKAMGEGLCEKIFYLTAKTITRTVAGDAMGLLLDGGLRARAITITAKDKICFSDERRCTPSHCPYADGHFDRVNAAILDLLEHGPDFISRDVIERYARAHRVCPFELTLDAALWCDVIVCDYNYVFDPQVYLRRFFQGGGGDSVFLADEAHNLPDRAREMFSAEVRKSDFLAVKKTIDKRYRRLRSNLTKINTHLLTLSRALDTGTQQIQKAPPSDLLALLEVFLIEFAKWLGENRDAAPEVLEHYFAALAFTRIAQMYDEGYVTLIQRTAGGGLTLRLSCLDPSNPLADCLRRGRAAVFFSATLTPVDFYAAVLEGDETARTLVLPSPFPRERLLLLTADTVSTRYRHRGQSAEYVADMIFRTAAARRGNYIAYFPSYRYMLDVYEIFAGKYPAAETACQSASMSEAEREAFLARFNAGGAVLGFCVLGGVFSEGIDLGGERLIGTVIVGVGLPQINDTLDVIRDYYEARNGMGFEFAYRFPGMNKVLQAAGRVIRSEADRGVVLLIDDRFTSRAYRPLMPAHWADLQTVGSLPDLDAALGAFWARPG